MSEHHPFRSIDAKEKCLAMFEAREKSNWPVKSEHLYVETSYGKTFVRAHGPVNAPHLVLLHGIGTNSLSWNHNIKDLSKEFRTYAVDIIDDYGLSINTTPIKNSSDHVKWLDELFTKLGFKDNINIIGHSYGSWMASQYALRFQKRLKKIVLIAPAATVLPIIFQFHIRHILSLLPFRYFKESLFSWVDPTEKHKFEVKKQADLIAVSMKCYKPRYRVVRPTVLSDEDLKSLKCQAFFLFGEKERIYSPDKAMERLDNIAPHIKKVIIPGVGHMSILQSPLLNKKIIAFLEGQQIN